MKKFKKVAFLIVSVYMFAFAFMGCKITNEKTIRLNNVQVGEIISIQLKSYGGTSYRWNYEIDTTSGLEFVSSEFIPSNNDSDWVGGGKLNYNFKALSAGEYRIKFFAEDITMYTTELTASI